MKQKIKNNLEYIRADIKNIIRHSKDTTICKELESVLWKLSEEYLESADGLEKKDLYDRYETQETKKNKWPKSIYNLIEALMAYLKSIEDEEIKAQTAEVIMGLRIPIVRTGSYKREIIRLCDLLTNISFRQEVIRTLCDITSKSYFTE